MRLQRLMLAAAIVTAWVGPMLAQPTPLPTPKAAPTNAVAATVNGQPVPESMVQRGLSNIPPEKHAEARPDLLNFLIDNLLVEQYLQQQQIKVEKTEVDKRIEEMRKEAEKEKKDFLEILKLMKYTEAELRENITTEIRWDKYASTQASEKVLKEMFEANKEMFDGTMVRARHILLTPAPNDAKSAEQAQSQLRVYKKDVEEKVSAGLSKLPASADALAREKARTQLTDEAFAGLAREKSSCPSKAQGGDVSWFQRAGYMVEPFARAAFTLKLYQMSDVVKTQFGYHLILVTDRKSGRDVKFEDVQGDVKDVYYEKLRESLAAQVRAKSKVVISPNP